MPSDAVTGSRTGATIAAWVIPGASSTEVVGLHGDRVKLRVSAPADRGRANRESIRLLEQVLDAPVTLVRGMGSRQKVFEVAGLDDETVLRKLGIG